MQTDTAILESNRHKRRVKRAVEKKLEELDSWLFKHGIPRARNNEIKERIQQELAERRDVDVNNILSILPEELQNYIKSCLPLSRLKKVRCSIKFRNISFPSFHACSELQGYVYL